ncbi:hypothetical protein [Rugosimonospora africana]|uniref:Uncharacterized protein n=1 Tax=Rugosimonospora africana TaxID=556532 RepID=A0A8J3R0A9_9ACTN|nr:hypothetical protein [Rugosimonospora africana]GIH19861.1 hypothetical protein Raf01_80330 [Rugosimonospora africana]
MGNRFTADGSPYDAGGVYLSNGATDVFYDVLTLAGCSLAETPWQQNLVVRFADGHRLGLGCDGFDLGDLPWTTEWPGEKTFLLRVVDLAASRHRWDLLRYDPPVISAQLAAFGGMVAGFTPVPVRASAWGDWRKPPPSDRLSRCPSHDLYEGEFGCRLCEHVAASCG